MALIALKCPNCGGTVQLEEDMKQGFCIHCGNRILNQPSTGNDKRSEVTNYLNIAKDALYAKNWTAVPKLLDKIFQIDWDCKDAWYMKAIWSYGIEADYNGIMERIATRPMNNYGIFFEEDIKKCWGEFNMSISIKGSKSPKYYAFVTIDGKDSRIIRRDKVSVIGIDGGDHTIEAGPTMIDAVDKVTDKISFTVTKDHEFVIEFTGMMNPPKAKITMVR
jgi:DNA-directed RNA polymerase subunit RPC12/RpoP